MSYICDLVRPGISGTLKGKTNTTNEKASPLHYFIILQYRLMTEDRPKHVAYMRNKLMSEHLR
jgi:hypothetical protein